MAENTGLRRRAPDLFLLGLLSLLDAMLDRPLKSIVDEMPLEADLSSALLGGRNRMGQILALALAVERGDWTAAGQAAHLLGEDDTRIADYYLEAMSYPDTLWTASGGYEEESAGRSGTHGY